MLRKRIVYIILAFVVLLPFWMFLAWALTSKTKMVVAIIDKTALTTQGQEHISLTWLLNHQRLTKTTSARYSLSGDYFGFFPLADEKFRIKGLERFSVTQLDQLSMDADLVYFTDTYGIYQNEWYKKGKNTERSGMLYGGLSDQDLVLLQEMKAKKKLIITEFNTIGSPTKALNREKFEQLFSMNWTGWTGRYFDSFDTTVNKELPRWLINNYKKTNGGKWGFKKSGIAFVNQTDQVIILEDGTDLNNPVPQIITGPYGQDYFSLPEKIKYSFWFDVIAADSKVNQTISRFQIQANAKGKALLLRSGIPSEFPAVLMYKGKDYGFYYFSGDFCDNPIGMSTSYFKGIEFFKWLFYNNRNPSERASFFWNFYNPLMTRILDQEKLKLTRQH